MELTERIEQIYDTVVAHRRWLHAHPEPSGQEKNTAAYIAEVLRKIGLTPTENVGGYGVVALIQGDKPGKCVGLRADFDALNQQEATGLPFASQNPGVFHGCGHDVHTAMLLGAAQILYDLRHTLAGSVKLIFQPSEENVADSGAKRMIADGVLENPKVDVMFAQHMSPHYPTGIIALRSGPMSASSDRFVITVNGKSSHGSAPEDGVDAVVMGAQVVSALQSIVSRNIGPQDSAVLTIGTVQAGSRYNIIPDSFKMEGTCRTLNPEIQNAMPKRMEGIVAGITQGMGGSYTFSYTKGFSPIMNDPAQTEQAVSTATALLSSNQVVLQDKATMIGEDFSFFAQSVPSVFYWLGCRQADAPFYPLHSNQFCPDEAAMRTGIAMLVSAACHQLT